MIGALGSVGRVSEAVAAFETMTQSGLLPHALHYQLLIIAYARCARCVFVRLMYVSMRMCLCLFCLCL